MQNKTPQQDLLSQLLKKLLADHPELSPPLENTRGQTQLPPPRGQSTSSDWSLWESSGSGLSLEHAVAVEGHSNLRALLRSAEAFVEPALQPSFSQYLILLPSLPLSLIPRSPIGPYAKRHLSQLFWGPPTCNTASLLPWALIPPELKYTTH